MLRRSASSFCPRCRFCFYSDCDAKCGDVGGTFSEHIGLCECHGMQVTCFLGSKVVVVINASLVFIKRKKSQIASSVMHSIWARDRGMLVSAAHANGCHSISATAGSCLGPTAHGICLYLKYINFDAYLVHRCSPICASYPRSLLTLLT